MALTATINNLTVQNITHLTVGTKFICWILKFFPEK